jgi:group II intron reverse transcriptase/maturase
MTPDLAQFTVFAHKNPTLKFNSLMGLIFRKEGLRESFRLLQGSKAAGSDGIKKDDYRKDLENNLTTLSDRVRRGGYTPKSVLRVYIPKSSGTGRRPLGIPAFEDRIVQDRIAGVLQAIWEPEFLDCSFGFRPGRNAHQAIKVIDKAIMKERVNYVVEADIKGFFNHVDHTWLLKFLAHRIKDERFIQPIKKFLQGSIMEDGAVRSCEEGTPQGGLISPCLSNIYLHYVLDLWFDRLFRRSCKGTARFVRYCDDYVAMFEFEEDAKRFMVEMSSRLQKFSLEVEPTNTKMLAFGIKEFRSALKSSRHVDTFSFLGFTHYMRKSRRGYPMVDRKTDAVRLRRKVKEFSAQLAKRRNQGTKLIVEYACSHFRGHLQYYGISGNIRSLRCYRFLVLHYLFKCLNRRSQRRSLMWEKFHLLINSFGLAKSKVIHALW